MYQREAHPKRNSRRDCIRLRETRDISADKGKQMRKRTPSRVAQVAGAAYWNPRSSTGI